MLRADAEYGGARLRACGVEFVVRERDVDALRHEARCAVPHDHFAVEEVHAR